ncbi:MAG: NADH-quinone oxidoreductase subunit N [Anaerolineae bacterium]|nr:MAG: NADH-quinone oxidoreductase subunit N [Anaerolineae bacterium]
MGANYLAILPEISLAVLAALLILIDLRLKPERKHILPGLTAGGLLLVLVATLLFARPAAGAGESIWGGMLRHDLAAYIFRIIFLFGAAATAILTQGWKTVERRGEFYVLLVLSTLGMTLMAASADLIMLFLAIETASIPLYVMAGFMTSDDKSTEAGVKYLLFGAATSAVMLYGFSLLYGFAGTTDLYELSAAAAAGDLPVLGLAGVLVLALAGFGFKVAVVPFHFWAPDVYEGAPTPVTAFLSTASKAAGFAVILRFLLAAYPLEVANWGGLVAVMAVVSMTVGNAAALAQKNIKRLLAYSSIAHAGYILMGIAAGTVLGATGVVYYLAVYLVTNMAAFAVVIIFFNVVGSDDIASYAGLSRRHQGLAFAMLVAFLSLAGVPPLGGFFAKILVFAAAVEANLVWLAIAGVLNAILGLYYYLMVLKVIYLDRSEDESKPLPVRRSHMAVLVVCLVLVLVLGTVLGPLYDWSTIAAGGLF